MQDDHSSEYNHVEPLSSKRPTATHVDVARKDNVHAMLKEEVLQHRSPAEPLRRRTMLSGASQRQHDALCASHSCPTSCRRDDVPIEQPLGGVARQVTALQRREFTRAKRPLAQHGRGGELLIVQGMGTHMARASACHA